MSPVRGVVNRLPGDLDRPPQQADAGADTEAGPFAGPTHQPALACRLYATDHGFDGVPDLLPLRQALKRAAHEGRA